MFNNYISLQKKIDVVHTLDSNILRDELKFKQKLGEWLTQTGNWKICWRATQDGWAGTTFHNLCDGKVPTLTIVKVVKDNKNLIFGGYTTVTWAGYSKFYLDFAKVIHSYNL